MNNKSSVLYRQPAAEPTKPSVVRKNSLIGNKKVSIDVNLDQENDDQENDNESDKGPSPGNFEFNRPQLPATDSERREKKNFSTVGAIAFITLLLFALAGWSVKLSHSNNTRLPASTDSTDIPGFSTSVEPNNRSRTNYVMLYDTVTSVDDASLPLSEILSSRISLVSSNNPKFIVTANGTKIVPNDVIDGKLTVVDIFADHVLVSSDGTIQAIAY